MSALAPTEQLAPSDGKDPTAGADAFEDVEVRAGKAEANSGALQPPAAVAALSPDERRAKERAMVRKIDFRLLPSVIIMYIMKVRAFWDGFRIPGVVC